MRRHAIWSVLAVLAVGLGLTLAGCTGGDQHNLPNLGGTTKAATDDFEQKARAYYQCLRDANLPARLTEATQDFPIDVGWEDNVVVMWTLPSGLGGVQGDVDSDAINDFFSGNESSYSLIVNGVDHTETFQGCHESTGYDESEGWANSGKIDSAYLQAVVDSSNEWAACARENGWPGLKDAVLPTATDGSEYPVIALPTTITEDQLRQLLTACPNFDEERTRHNDELANEGWDQRGGLPEGFWIPPSIGFDHPGFNGKPVEPGAPGEEPSAGDPLLERLNTLQQVLYEAANAYYESQGEGAIVID
jgi:hypothetical protein